MNARSLGVKIARQVFLPSNISGPTNAYTVAKTIADAASPPGSLFDNVIGEKYKRKALDYIAGLRTNERAWLDKYTKNIWDRYRGRSVDLENLYDRASTEIPNSVLPPKAWDALHSSRSKVDPTDEYIKYNIRKLRESYTAPKPPLRTVSPTMLGNTPNNNPRFVR